MFSFSGSAEERESIELSAFFESLAASDLFFLFSPTKYSETRQKLIKYSNSNSPFIVAFKAFSIEETFMRKHFHAISYCWFML